MTLWLFNFSIFSNSDVPPNLIQSLKKQCNPTLKKSFKERNPDVDMDEIQNNPNVPDDVKAAISGAMSLTLEEEEIPIEGDAVPINEEEEFASYDEDFNLSDAERKSKKNKRRRHQTDDENNDDDGDWLSNRGKRKKKSKRGKRAKKEKKKRDKEKKRMEKRKTESEPDADAGGNTSVDITEKPKKGSRKRKSTEGTDLTHSSIENENGIVDCDTKVKREKRPKKHKMKIQKTPPNDANILATIEAVVNGHGEPGDGGTCGGRTIEMKIEMADSVIARVGATLNVDGDYVSSAVTVSAKSYGNDSSSNILSMGKVDNTGLDQCASLIKLASETTNTRKKKTATNKSETNAKRK